MAVINVGAATETEMKEKKARVEDALHATRAAVEEGIVPGGGVAYLRCLPGAGQAEAGAVSRTSAWTSSAARSRSRCGRSPATRGLEGAVIVNKVKRGQGRVRLQRRAPSVYEDLREGRRHRPDQGRAATALQNAASVASLMLTTEAMVAERPKKKAKGAGGGGGAPDYGGDDMEY